VCFDCGRDFELPDAHGPAESGLTGNARSRTSSVISGKVPQF
jgi:hypothetical protein